MMAAILNSTIFEFCHLYSVWLWNSDTIVFFSQHKKKLSLTLWLWLPTFAIKKTSLIHSDLNLMMVAILKFAILNSAILDSASALWNSDTLFSSLRFTQKHSPSTLTLTQTNSNWLKLIHSHSTWWWQTSRILPTQHSATAILDSVTLLSCLRFTQKHSPSILTLTQTNLIWQTHSFSL